MNTIFLLLSISCSGHVNAQCHFGQRFYQTLEDCELARGREKWQNVCIPIINNRKDNKQ